MYDVDNVTVELLRYRILTDSLLKAITSVKLSPTCRHGLLGYGVRSEGRVESHEFGLAASEVVNLDEEGLPWSAVMCDEFDEVGFTRTK